MSISQTWFITGCSTGLGRALAIYLLAHGHRVVATARKPANIASLPGATADNYLALPLDVTQPGQIEATVAQAWQRWGRVDVVVNNAGYGLVGSIEGMGDAQIRHQFEVNFFGAVAVTKAFLPLMRQAGGGRFLHVSSIAGLNAAPGGAMYSASKFALEGFSEGLHKEGAAVGITSTLIEPGPFRTDWAGRSLVYAEQRIEAYEATVGTMFAYLDGANGRQKGDPDRAAAAMAAVAAMDQPPLRLLLGAGAHRTFFKKVADLQAEAQQHEALTLSADYPDAA